MFMIKEMLAARLNTIHNLWFFADLMRQIREAIQQGTFPVFRQQFYERYRPAGLNS